MAFGTRTSLELEGNFTKLQVVSVLGKICGVPLKKKKKTVLLQISLFNEEPPFEILGNIMGVVAKTFLAPNSCKATNNS
jgi:hypothetical protein